VHSTTLTCDQLLVTEYEPLISMDLQQVLEDEGAMVFPASSLTQALRRAQRPALSAAVIDIKLRTENAEPFAMRLDSIRFPSYSIPPVPTVHRNDGVRCHC
jgi:DNA-binding response OmpR family regulator